MSGYPLDLAQSGSLEQSYSPSGYSQTQLATQDALNSLLESQHPNSLFNNSYNNSAQLSPNFGLQQPSPGRLPGIQGSPESSNLGKADSLPALKTIRSPDFNKTASLPLINRNDSPSPANPAQTSPSARESDLDESLEMDISREQQHSNTSFANTTRDSSFTPSHPILSMAPEHDPLPEESANDSQKENRSSSGRSSGRPSQAVLPPKQPLEQQGGVRYQSAHDFRAGKAIKPEKRKKGDMESDSDEDELERERAELDPDQQRIRARCRARRRSIEDEDEGPPKPTQNGEQSTELDEGDSSVHRTPRPTAGTVDMSMDDDSAASWGCILPRTQPPGVHHSAPASFSQQMQDNSHSSQTGSLDHSPDRSPVNIHARHLLADVFDNSPGGVGISMIAGSSPSQKPSNQSQLSYEPTRAEDEISHLNRPFQHAAPSVDGAMTGSLESRSAEESTQLVEPTQLDTAVHAQISLTAARDEEKGVPLFRERIVSNGSTTSDSRRPHVPPSRALKRVTPQPETSSPPPHGHTIFSPQLKRVQESGPEETDSSSPAPVDNELKRLADEEASSSPAPAQRDSTPSKLPGATQFVDETVELERPPDLDEEEVDELEGNESQDEDEEDEPIVLVGPTPATPNGTALGESAHSVSPTPTPSPPARRRSARGAAKQQPAAKPRAKAGRFQCEAKQRAGETVSSTPAVSTSSPRSGVEPKPVIAGRRWTRNSSAKPASPQADETPPQRPRRAGRPSLPGKIIPPTPWTVAKNSPARTGGHGREQSAPAAKVHATRGRNSVPTSQLPSSVAAPAGRAKSGSVGATAEPSKPPARAASAPSESAGGERLKLVPIAAQAQRAAVKMNRKSDSYFSGMAFFVTLSAAEPDTTKRRPETAEEAKKRLRDDLTASIERNGGVNLDSRDLFAVADADRQGQIKPEFATASLGSLKHIFLLANTHLTTPKYLVALALGVPIISHKFIEDSVHARETLDWRLYALGAGHINHLGIDGPGSQVKVYAKKSFDLWSIAEEHSKGALFGGCSFLLALDKLTRETIHDWRAVLAAAGASRADFVDSIADAKTASEYDYALVDVELGDRKLGRLAAHAGLASKVWFRQCLIAGTRLPPELMQ